MLIEYLLQNAIIHSVDALIVGGGYWLIRFTRRSVLGGILIALYILATIGNASSDAGVSGWGVSMAVIGIMVAELLGRWLRRGSSNAV